MMLFSLEKLPDSLHPPQNPKPGIQALQFSAPNYFLSLPMAASVIHTSTTTSKPFSDHFSSGNVTLPTSKYLNLTILSNQLKLLLLHDLNLNNVTYK